MLVTIILSILPITISVSPWTRRGKPKEMYFLIKVKDGLKRRLSVVSGSLLDK